MKWNFGLSLINQVYHLGEKYEYYWNLNYDANYGNCAPRQVFEDGCLDEEVVA